MRETHSASHWAAAKPSALPPIIKRAPTPRNFPVPTCRICCARNALELAQARLAEARRPFIHVGMNGAWKLCLKYSSEPEKPWRKLSVAFCGTARTTTLDLQRCPRRSASLEHDGQLGVDGCPWHKSLVGQEAARHRLLPIRSKPVIPLIVVKRWPPRVLLHHKPAARHWASRLAALALVEIRTLDHFVVAGANVSSFAERGLIWAGTASHQRNCPGSGPAAIIRGQTVSPDEFADEDCPRVCGSNPTLPNFRSAR
jgi:hypothetical protein